MPLIRFIKTDSAKIGIWNISEREAFFSNRINLGKNVQHPHKRLQHLAARYLLTELEPDFPVNEIQIA
ncbi:MAG: 4-phosphopantetheinyl transferase, partial [Chitinophagaceae bacterium]